MTRALQQHDGSSSSGVDVAAAWVAWLGGRPATTVRARRADLEALARFVAERPNGGDLLAADELAAQLVEIGPSKCRALIAAWHTYMDVQGLIGTTIARRISTVSSWFRELGEHGLGWSPRLPRPHVASYQQRQCPAHARVMRVAAELEQQGRDRELVALLLVADVGLRRAEACSLWAPQLSREPPGYNVRRKGGRMEFRPFSSRLAAAIDRLLDGRTSGPVLTSAIGRPLSATGLRHMIVELLGHSPHRLRNTGGGEIYRRTRDVEQLRRWLGHKNLATSQRYVAELLEDYAGDATRLLAGE